MKRLHFLYEINLFMSQDVTDHHFQLKCIPMENGAQHCLSLSCVVNPPVNLTKTEDGFGNRGFSGVITKEHSALEIMAEGIVETGGVAFSETPAFMYKFQSSMTQPGDALESFYKKIQAEQESGCTDTDRALFMMNALFGNFSYAGGVTNVKTTAEEAFAGGTGVCQDYAHILISLLRSAGIPARYVAGLLLGEGATHAWVEAWTGAGWMGLDPTHNRPVDDTYIKLTHGRDFNDGYVDRGHFTGCAFQSQQIYVKVEEVFDQG